MEQYLKKREELFKEARSVFYDLEFDIEYNQPYEQALDNCLTLKSLLEKLIELEKNENNK